MSHVHYKHIKRWIEDTSRVILVEKTNSSWDVSKRQTFPFWYEECKYLVVEAKHKDAALHWLNGGDVQRRYSNGDWYMVSRRSELASDEFTEYKICVDLQSIELFIGIHMKNGNILCIPEIDMNNMYDKGMYTWTKCSANIGGKP
jgi:hypothetical protein